MARNLTRPVRLSPGRRSGGIVVGFIIPPLPRPDRISPLIRRLVGGDRPGSSGGSSDVLNQNVTRPEHEAATAKLSAAAKDAWLRRKFCSCGSRSLYAVPDGW